MSYVILSTRAIIRAGHLEIVSKVRDDRGKRLDAVMFQREVAALIPRFVLIGSNRKANRALLETIQSIASRMTEGRRVTICKRGDTCYYSFMSWEEVLFSSI